MRAKAVLQGIATMALVAGLPAQADATAYPATLLERFGPPTEGFDAKTMMGDCYGYRAAGRRMPIGMGGTQYTEGFQLSTGLLCRGEWTWTWHLGGHYSGFSACVGLAGGDTDPARLSFVGPKGTPMSFGADGVQVRVTTLVAGLPSFVTLGTEQMMNLIIRTTTPGAIIGFGDDGVYPGGIPARECQ